MRVRQVSEEEFKERFPKEEIKSDNGTFYLASIPGDKEVGLVKDPKSGIIYPFGVDEIKSDLSNCDDLELIMMLSDPTIDRGADSENGNKVSVLEMVLEHKRELKLITIRFWLYRIFVWLLFISVMIFVYYILKITKR